MTIRTYEVVVDWYGDLARSYHTAKSRSAARYDRYLEISDVWDLTFREFLSLVRSVRASPCPYGYNYVRESYGVDVKVGQEVYLPKGRSGIVGAPRHSRAARVVVLNENGFAGEYHPCDITEESA